MQKLGHQVERFHKEQQAAVDRPSRALRGASTSGSPTRKEQFGRSGTPYDFGAPEHRRVQARRCAT